MKTHTNFLLFLVILCLVADLILSLRPSGESQEPEHFTDPQVVRLQARNDSLTGINLSLDRSIAGYQAQADSLRQKIADTKRNIYYLKQQHYETIHHMDSLNGLELYRYFAKFNP